MGLNKGLQDAVLVHRIRQTVDSFTDFVVIRRLASLERLPFSGLLAPLHLDQAAVHCPEG
jgi:hypothetical protein